MNDFRDRVLTGKPDPGPLLRAKRPARHQVSRAAEDESFAEVVIHRDAQRLANHRDGDRHRLDDEQVEILVDGESQVVTLVNLSGGGAMIEGAKGLRLWSRLHVRFPGNGELEAAVRWVRGDRHGVEFAEDTLVNLGQEGLHGMLQTAKTPTLPVLARERTGDDQPDAEPLDHPEAQPPTEREARHPLIWSGQIHYDYETLPVRLRNISTGGALIERPHALPQGAELMLDLGKAGNVFAIVSWARGDLAGLRFEKPYDLAQLAKGRPQVAAQRWVTPDHLRHAAQGNSPWPKQWGSEERPRKSIRRA